MSDHERVQSLTLKPLCDLSREIEGAQVSAFQLGPGGRIWLALRVGSGTARRLRVLSFAGAERVLDVEFLAPPFETHLVQPVGDGFLVACSRCGCGSGAGGACAAALYDREGRLVKPLNLGEGIANLQVSASGAIWAGYLAEAEFDHFSWTRPPEQPGLAVWGASGELVHVFRGPPDLEELDDCYALNVASDSEVWFLHFPRFALVKLHDHAVAGVWDLPLAGGCTFAVADGIALLRGDENDRDNFQVVALRPGGLHTALGAVRFMDEKGRGLESARTSARAGELALLHGGRIYRSDARSAAAALTLT